MPRFFKACLLYTSCQVFFLHILWFNLVKVVIDVFSKPFVPIGNLQQSSESGVVAGCRIEGYRAVAVLKLLGVQQVLSELLTQVHIYLAKGTLPFDEVVEKMCIRDR